jgi:hypothetical protein
MDENQQSDDQNGREVVHFVLAGRDLGLAMMLGVGRRHAGRNRRLACPLGGLLDLTGGWPLKQTPDTRP